MKAIQYSAFGDSSVIEITDVEKPIIKDDEVLIKAHAVTVNPADMKFRTGAFQARMPIELPFIP